MLYQLVGCSLEPMAIAIVLPQERRHSWGQLLLLRACAWNTVGHRSATLHKRGGRGQSSLLAAVRLRHVSVWLLLDCQGVLV